MTLEDLRYSKAFEFKKIPICWAITEGYDGGTRLIFDLDILCHELNFDPIEVMNYMGTFSPYKEKWYLMEIKNPWFNSYTIDSGVMVLVGKQLKLVN